MQYFPYLLVLVSLSSLSLIILAILRILDFAYVSSRQKIIILKISLTMIASAPFIFILLNLFSWHTVKITFSTKFINHLSISTAPVTFTESQSHWSFYIFTAYAIGFLVMLSQILSSYLIARKQLAGSTLSVIQEQTVYLNKHIQSPLSFGFPKTKIYFPWNTEKKWAPREIQMSLAHENIHLEQHDSLWKLLSLLIRALLFFVPWSYSLHRRFELEIEIFCDEKTCIITKANAEEYGGLLIAMTCVQPKNLIVTNITDSTLKRRLLAMKSRTIQRPLLTSMASNVASIG